MTAVELGVGLYTPSEAARLVGLRQQRVRRWLSGDDAAPLLEHDFDDAADRLVLSFLDLVEVRFVRAFLDTGVSIHTIRVAAEVARKEFATRHPFATCRLETDGRSVFARLGKRNHRLVDLAKQQVVLRQVFDPLVRQIEYGVRDEAQRWWPLGKRRPVVLDPTICFGQPVSCAIPTRVLAAPILAKANSEREVAKWYDVPLANVRAAVEFERGLGKLEPSEPKAA